MQLIQKTDSELIALLKAGDFIGWEYLYQKYAALMYGTIMPAVSFNKTLANEMLIKCFSELKNRAFFNGSLPSSLGLCLVQHCCSVLKTALPVPDDGSKAHANCAYPLLKAVILDKEPLKAIAAAHGLTEAMAMTKLRAELKENRNSRIADLV